MIRKLVIVSTLMLLLTVLDVGFALPAPKSICFAGIGCPYADKPEERLNEKALERLGCQPLAAIRARILDDHEMCFPESFVHERQLFNQRCPNSSLVAGTFRNNKSFTDNIPVSVQAQITLIMKIERMKHCVK